MQVQWNEMSKVLPKVGIIYSESSKTSNESKYFAHYLCGNLVATKYAILNMIGMQSDGAPTAQSLPVNKRISFIPPRQTKAIEIPVIFAKTYIHKVAVCNTNLHLFLRLLMSLLGTGISLKRVILLLWPLIPMIRQSVWRDWKKHSSLNKLLFLPCREVCVITPQSKTGNTHALCYRCCSIS